IFMRVANRRASSRLLVVLDFLVVGIDDTVVIVAALGTFGSFRLLGLIDGLAEFHRHFHQRLGLRLDVVGIRLGGLDGGLQRGDRVLNGLAIGLGDLLAIFL